MFITKYKIATLVKVVLSVLVVVWFVGWQSISYDKNDINIGQKVIFTTPMIIVTGIPDSMAGEVVADNYGAMIWKESYWENIKSNFPKLNTRKIRCNEAFTVQNVLIHEVHGFLMGAFVGSNDVKMYVLSSSNSNKMVISEGSFVTSSKNIISSVNNGRISKTDNCKAENRIK